MWTPQAQQISGANALYKTDNGVNATDIVTDLEGDYLAQVPTGSRISTGDFEISGNDLRIQISAANCDVTTPGDNPIVEEIGKQLGLDTNGEVTNCVMDTDTFFRFSL